jgi:hypothetical protein
MKHPRDTARRLSFNVSYSKSTVIQSTTDVMYRELSGASILVKPGSDATLKEHSANSGSNTSPRPLILELFQGRPEAVLVLLELLELLVLTGSVLVAFLLRGLILLVATDVAEEGVVQGRAEKDNRVCNA